MKKNEGDFGYQYTLDICEAISLYTSTIFKIDNQAFIYRASDLRYAIERCLYIQCINSKKLYSKYLFKKQKLIKSNFICLKNYEKDIYNLIFHKNDYRINTFFKWFYSLIKKTIHFYRFIKLFKERARVSSAGNYKVVFNFSNKKFLNYVRPILNYLEESSFVFQVGSDEQLSKVIQNEGFKVLEINNKYKYLNHFFVSKFLADFLELLKDYDNNISALENKNIKSIVTFEGNSPQDIIILEVAKKLKIPCYCIQQGWSPYIHNGFRNMSFTDYFIWGNEFKNQLVKYNPNQNFTISGSPYLKKSLSQTEVLKIKTLSFFLQPVCPLMSQSAFDKFIKLIFICSKTFPDLNIIVKEHPSSNLKKELKKRFSKNKNITLYESNSQKLNQILELSDLTLSVFSSVILESIHKNKLPIICNFGSIPKYLPYIVEKDCAIEIFSINDAIKIIKNLINTPETLKKYQKNILKIKRNLFSQKNASKLISSKIK